TQVAENPPPPQPAAPAATPPSPPAVPAPAVTASPTPAPTQPAPVEAPAPPVQAQPAPVPPAPEPVATPAAQTVPPEEVATPAPAPAAPVIMAQPAAQPVAQAPQAAPAGNPAPEAYTEPPPPRIPAVQPLGSTKAHFKAAWDAVGNGLYGEAIAHFSAAIRREPGYADAYFGRGWAYEKAGQYREAIADYSRTIDLRPDHVNAYFGRGVLNLYSGNYREAGNDFHVASVRSTGELKTYSLLWRYISKARGDSGAGRELEQDILGIDTEGWPGVLAAYFVGWASERDVMRRTRQEDAQKQLDRECVAHFFIGQQRLIVGDIEGAIESFRRAVATGAYQYRQYEAARVELRRLNES
ncbi:MAG: tetratricopeptide repeat protein, partial [Magnetospiraceae bacterium]